MDRFDFIELDQSKKAVPQQDQPLQARPHDGPSFYQAGRQMRAAGHFSAAVAYYEKVLGFNDQHYAAWAELIDSLVRLGELDRAEAKAQEAVQNYGKVRLLYAGRALVSAHRGHIDPAYNFSDISVDDKDASWYAWCVRAEVALHGSRENRFFAAEMLEKAFEKAESEWEPYVLAGWMHLDANLPVLAAAYFAEAARYNPLAPICWLGLGDSFLQLRLYDQARFYYQRVTELEPNHKRALERQAQCCKLMYGLMRPFRPESLYRRWKKEYDKLL
ncbi:MAG TPA: tetratricopeptide repeat protein [Candidatus Hydrogenedentes bacterium]|nr:tetratricopeptide repeat protein [Candidatus Hydrogenedentota bacterium]